MKLSKIVKSFRLLWDELRGIDESRYKVIRVSDGHWVGTLDGEICVSIESPTGENHA